MILTPEQLQTITPEALEAVFQQHCEGLAPSLLRQTRVELRHLYAAPLVFQPRDAHDSPWLKKAHVRGLGKAIANSGGVLDPILLFPVAGMRIVVDGHCRLKAYHDNDRSGRKQVPVRYLKANSVRGAMLEAARRNSKNKLAMTEEEKMGAAWRIVVVEDGGKDRTSKKEIAAACGCSPATIGNMRAVLAKHPIGSDPDPRQMKWREAQRIGVKMGEHDEDAHERRVKQIATKLRQTFGDAPERDPELYLDALQLAYSGIAALVEDMQASAEEVFEESQGCDF